MQFVTDFADQAVILPLLLATAIILLAGRQRQAAAVWVLAVAGVLGSILVLKTLCYACGWLIPVFAADRWNVQSPSGHVGSAVVVYAGLILLVAGPAAGPGRVPRMAAALVASLAIALVIGVTRLRLGAHTLSEVVIAAAIGGIGALLVAAMTRPLPPGRARWSVAAGLAVVWIVFHGIHLPAENAIRNTMGERLRLWIAACQPGPI